MSMQAKGVKRRLEFLTRDLALPEWRLLAALAMERELPQASLQRLAQYFGAVVQGAQRVAGAQRLEAPKGPLGGWLSSGLVTEARGGYAVTAEFRQLVIRRLAALGELARVAEATQSLLGDRSLAVTTLLVASGRFTELDRAAYLLPLVSKRLGEEQSLEALIFEAIARPFDAEWFEATLGEQAPKAAERALSTALFGLWQCDGLFEWALERAAAQSPAAVHPGAREPSRLPLLVCEHAILRGRPELAEQLVPLLADDARGSVQAAVHYLHGDLPAAQRLLGGGEAGNGAASPGKARSEAGAVGPLLALLAYGGGSPREVSRARQLLGARPGEAGSGIERAFRTFVRYGSEAAASHARLDPHQLASSARGWELLLLGLTAHLHQHDRVTRAGWAVHLARAGSAWIEAGYVWLARQALFLSRALDQDYFQREFEAARERHLLDRLEPRPLELSLADLVTPSPDWQRTLTALERVAELARGQAEITRRVVWYLNMVDGSLERPALSQFSDAGWSRGRRLSLAELCELRDELPPEDARVVAELRRGALPGDARAEALEALIGHPRVVSGARGGTPVEVVRGTCRIETEDDGGYLKLEVVPRGARAGLEVVVESASRIAVYRVPPAMQRVIELVPEGLRVPAEHAKEALRVLAQLARGVEVHSRHLGADRRVEADATPCLRVVPKAGAWLVQAGVRPFGSAGRFFIAGSGPLFLSLYTGGERLQCERDPRLERAGVSRLILACPSLLERALDAEGRAPGDPIESWDFDRAGLLELLLELSESDQPSEIEWPESTAMELRGRVSTRHISGTLRSKKGWYLASGSVSLDGGMQFDLSELLLASPVEGGRFVRLPNGDYLALEAQVEKVLAALAQVGELRVRQREVELPQSALQTLGLLGALERQHGAFTLDAGAHAWLARAEAVRDLEFELPAPLDGVLRGYQQQGYRWLCRLSELGLGACLADDMGLGKTLQILALLLRRVSEGPALVVAPTSVCSNWLAQAARFAPGLVVAEYAGAERAELLEALASEGKRPDLVVCSYGLMQQDIEALSRIQWGSVVLDEAQFIKNPRSQRAVAACRLAAPCRIAATGTPVENHLADLWSIFHFLNPGLLGSFRTFGARFLKAIEQRKDERARDALRETVKPFILRRMKADVLQDLPPLTLVHYPVELSESEAHGYALLRRQIRDKLFTPSGRRDNKIEILAEITRLRRYCCHPRLVFPGADTRASKLDALLELVLDLRENQHRALVFSQFVDFLTLVRERFDEAMVSYQYLDGSTPREQRRERVEAFQAGTSSVFLISLKAGGFGLNLTSADYVIHLDPWWNPAVEAQATDRAHRIGQDRPVTVYRLIAKDTIEDDIVALHRNKRELADALLSEGETPAELSTSELIDLIEQTL